MQPSSTYFGLVFDNEKELSFSFICRQVVDEEVLIEFLQNSDSLKLALYFLSISVLSPARSTLHQRN